MNRVIHVFAPPEELMRFPVIVFRFQEGRNSSLNQQSNRSFYQLDVCACQLQACHSRIQCLVHHATEWFPRLASIREINARKRYRNNVVHEHMGWDGMG